MAGRFPYVPSGKDMEVKYERITRHATDRRNNGGIGGNGLRAIVRTPAAKGTGYRGHEVCALPDSVDGQVWNDSYSNDDM